MLWASLHAPFCTLCFSLFFGRERAIIGATNCATFLPSQQPAFAVSIFSLLAL